MIYYSNLADIDISIYITMHTCVITFLKQIKSFNKKYKQFNIL